jgi:hypothetical protein
VIGVAGEDLLGAIELLEQQATHQKMWPGHWAKRQYRIGTVKDFGAETFGAADRKGEFCHTLIAPRREPIGKTAARPHGAALIEGDQPRSGRQCLDDQCRFARLQRRRGQALPHLELDNRDRRNDPPRIKRLQLGKRATAQPADGEKAEADRRGVLGLLASRLAVRQGFAPELFEVIVGAGLGPEQVHDHITGIDKHPIALRLALD